jgi:7,8-dihydropterin-6-yl-methyl-4-(beta-D-ribofuranosyl)aminobenzene 5'-phosphate synthase
MEVDRVEILTLIDNYIDILLPATDIVTRPPLAKEGKILADTLLAEHGLSLLITVYQGETKHTILLDTGYTKVGLLHNMERLGINAGNIEAIVISHGHMDHTGSLYAILDQLPARIPLVLHPGAFVHPRYTRSPDGAMRLWPQTLVQDDLEQQNVEITVSKTPTLIAEDMIMVTGEVERTTAFEKGMPNALLEKDGEYVQDPIKDDQALVINLAGKGLVVISGCAHAGIVNTVEYAKKLTGQNSIHAVLGGFHLTGPFFEKIHDETVAALKKMEPEVVMPMHCTGWKAIQKFQKEFASNFVLSSVGSKVMLS